VGKLTTAISGKLVAFDTAPLIYYIEEHPDYLPIVDELFNAFDAGDASGTTSVLTMHEVLVKPLRDGRQDIADKYREVLTNSANVTVHAIDFRSPRFQPRSCVSPFRLLTTISSNAQLPATMCRRQ